MADHQLYSGGGAVCVSSLERARPRALERASVRGCVYARVQSKPYTRMCARSCVRGIQCIEQCTERCIYTREIIAIGGALVSSRYIDLPASSSSSLSLLPKSEDFLRGPKGRNIVRPSVRPTIATVSVAICFRWMRVCMRASCTFYSVRGPRPEPNCFGVP